MFGSPYLLATQFDMNNINFSLMLKTNKWGISDFQVKDYQNKKINYSGK